MVSFTVYQRISHILLSVPLFVHFSFSLKKLCYRFLSSYLSRLLQIVYTPRGWQSVSCREEENKEAYDYFAFVFHFFRFPSLTHMQCIGKVSITDFSGGRVGLVFRASDSSARGRGFDSQSGRRVVSLSKTHFTPQKYW